MSGSVHFTVTVCLSLVIARLPDFYTLAPPNYLANLYRNFSICFGKLYKQQDMVGATRRGLIVKSPSLSDDGTITDAPLFGPPSISDDIEQQDHGVPQNHGDIGFGKMQSNLNEE